MTTRTGTVSLVLSAIFFCGAMLLGGCGATDFASVGKSNPLLKTGSSLADGARGMFSRTPVVELAEPQRELIRNSAGQTVDVSESPVKARIQDPTYSGFLTDIGQRQNRELAQLVRSLERADVTTQAYAAQAQKAAELRQQICQIEASAASYLHTQMAERVRSIDGQEEMLGTAAPASLATRRQEALALQGWLQRVEGGYRALLDSEELNRMDDLSIPQASATYLASAGK